MSTPKIEHLEIVLGEKPQEAAILTEDGKYIAFQSVRIQLDPYELPKIVIELSPFHTKITDRRRQIEKK